jgi:hypothetical protein
LDNPDNRVLLAFFFIFSEMWVAEFPENLDLCEKMGIMGIMLFYRSLR